MADAWEATLRDAWTRAADAHRPVRVSFERYRAFVMERCTGGDLESALASLQLGDLYLACGCTDGDPQAVDRFERELISQVPLFLAGSAERVALADEVKQLLRERLLVAGPEGRAALNAYAGRGPLGAWLRVAAVRTATDLLRQRTGGGEPRAPETVPQIFAAPELALVEARYRNVVERALKAAFDGLTPKERNVLRLHFLDGLNIERIGTMFQVHRATVARWIAASRQSLLDHVRRQVRDELGVSEAELDSLLVDLRSKLDVSLHALFKAG